MAGEMCRARETWSRKCGRWVLVAAESKQPSLFCQNQWLLLLGTRCGTSKNRQLYATSGCTDARDRGSDWVLPRVSGRDAVCVCWAC